MGWRPLFLFRLYRRVSVVSSTVRVTTSNTQRWLNPTGLWGDTVEPVSPFVGVVGEKGSAEWVWSDEERRVRRACYLSHSSTADVFFPPTRQTIDLFCVAIKTFTKQTLMPLQAYSVADAEACLNSSRDLHVVMRSAASFGWFPPCACGLFGTSGSGRNLNGSRKKGDGPRFNDTRIN